MHLIQQQFALIEKESASQLDFSAAVQGLEKSVKSSCDKYIARQLNYSLKTRIAKSGFFV